MTKSKKSQTLWQDSFKRLKKNKASMVSMIFIVGVCLTAIFAEEIAPFSYDEQNIESILTAPGENGYLLGTDSLGRDVFSRIIYGARMSMAVGIFTALISMVIGTIYGGISGWIGGRLDAVMMRFIDILISIPSLVLLILVKVIFDSVNLFSNPELKALSGMLLALSVVGWVTLARVVRGQVLQVKSLTFIEAGRALGVPSYLLLLKHVLPNILGPIIVLLTFQIPSNILIESFLSFIGLGLQPPYSSWGVLASDGWRSMRHYPHLIIFPSLALGLTMLAFNLFGDGLRDAFDPKLK